MHPIKTPEQMAQGPYETSDFPDLIPDTTVAFAVCKAVPEIVDEVGDSAKLEITHGSIKLENGMTIDPEELIDEPEVKVSPQGTYTLMLVDPDAPSPHAPKYRSWLHWLVINIPANDVYRGETVTEYMPPSPVKGKHRYLYLLYKQKGRVQVHPPARRQSFQVKEWAKDHNLESNPANGLFFWCESNASAEK